MRIIEVDALKAIAIVGVVFAHISFEGRLAPSTIEITSVIQLVLGWCVIAFFWASGFLENAKPKETIDIYHLAKKRFFRLIVPCFIFSLSYKLFLAFLYLTGRFSWENPIPTDITQLLKFIFNPVGPQFYFLYYLFGISFLFFILVKFLSVEKLFTIAIILFPIVYTNIETPTSGYGSDYNLIPFYFLSYLSGNYFSRSEVCFRRLFLFFVSSVLVTALISKSFIPFYILAPLIIQYYLKRMPRFVKAIDRTRIGKFSSGIYVWHAPIILPFMSIICVKLIGGSPVIIAPLVASTILMSVFISNLTFKFSWLRLWRF